MLKYGVVQGRLLPKVGDFIQNFPDDWRSEFEIAKRIGASHIEWIDGAPNEIKSVLLNENSLSVDVPISAVCLDWMTSPKRVGSHGLAEGLELVTMIGAAQRHGINKVVMPMLEASSLMLAKNRDQALFDDFIINLSAILPEFPTMTFSVETDLDVTEMRELIGSLSSYKNFNITFDMGNLTRLGYDLNKHIDVYGQFIDNVHVKDCKRFGTTVELGTGDTDLTIIKRVVTLPKVEYITFQTARSPGTEIQTFEHNCKIIEKLLCS